MRGKLPPPVRTFREADAGLGAAADSVTSEASAGRTVFTGTAVLSISDDAPWLLVRLNRRSRQNEPLKRDGVLCVNTAAPDCRALVRAFAGADNVDRANRFALALPSSSRSGAPILVGAVASFDRRITRAGEVNTHSIPIAAVLAIDGGREAGNLIDLDRRHHHDVT